MRRSGRWGWGGLQLLKQTAFVEPVVHLLSQAIVVGVEGERSADTHGAESEEERLYGKMYSRKDVN